MKKMRKGKKILLILIILVLVAIAAVLIVSFVKKQQSKQPEQPPVEESPIIELPETTYSNMEVRNVIMEYLKNNNETVVSMEIVNTTENKVEGGHFDVMWIGPEENVLGQILTSIQSLEVGQAHKVSVILKGDLTATTQIKLQK